MKMCAWRFGAALGLTVAIAVGGICVTARGAGSPVGSVVTWGGMATPFVPVESRFAAIAAGNGWSAALSSNGTVVAWGYDRGAQCKGTAGLTGVKAISAGYYAGLAILSDRTVAAWGENSYGQTNVPSGLTNVIAVSSGGNHCLALRSDGVVFAWGSFDGTNVPAGLSQVTAVAAGGMHSLALATNGMVVAWGYNNSGQCNVPAGLRAQAISAGDAHSLALTADGTVVAWGDNSYGQCNVPTTATHVVAIVAGVWRSFALKADGTVVTWGFDAGQGPAGSGFTAIAAGNRHGLALKADGTIVGWGDNTSGETFAPGSLNGMRAVAAGYAHLLALRTNGTVLAWGQSYYGAAEVPANLSNVVAVAGGYYHSLARLSDGTVAAWGNYYSGNGYYVPASVPAGLSNVVAISAGWDHDVALKANGTVVAWGSNFRNQTDVPPGLSGVVAIAAGAWHTLALKADGSLVGWGYSSYGQTNPPANLGRVIGMAAGTEYSVALKADGTAVAWGHDANGPITLPAALHAVVSMGTADLHGLALQAEGTVASWGANYYGQSTVPANLPGVLAVAATSEASVALVADSSMPPFLLGLNPGSQTAGIGCTVDFGAAAIGTPPLKYQWQTGSGVISGITDSVLELTQVQPAAAGAYTVVVTNAFGAVTSNPAILQVIPTPPFILSDPASQTVDQGMLVDFRVAVDGGCEPLSYQWLYNGAALLARTGAVLELPAVVPAQAGLYAVVVTNVFGAVTSAPAVLTVNAIAGQPPAIATEPVSQRGFVGGAVGLSVVATGSPQLSYQWLFNGAPLTGATTTALDLTGVQSAQSGFYAAAVTNLFGSITSAPARLLIVPGPQYRVLHDFAGPEGAVPDGDLILVGNTLYGVAQYGGAFTNSNMSAGGGTLFKLEADGSGFTALRSFSGADGSNPYGGLLLNGTSLYGTTQTGASGAYWGTVFRLNRDDSSFSSLYSFQQSTGGWPYAGLVAWGGNLFGVAEIGGPSDYGAIFRLSPSGSGYTVLKYFDSTTGANSLARLALSGNTLYGDLNGCGGVFKINTDGTGFRMLQRLNGIGGCVRMHSRLVISGDTLFGSAYEDNSYGSVFKLGTDGGNYTVLREFTNSYGSWEGMGGLALSGPVLYGAQQGSRWRPFPPPTPDYGAIFLVNTNGGGYTTVKSFNGTDGACPGNELLLAGDTLFGTTSYGGAFGNGVVFVLGFPPTLTNPPATQTVEVGTALNLEIGAAGAPPLRYQWWANGNSLPDATNALLTLDSAQFSDAGAYTVVVTNMFGAVTSAPANVSVIAAVPRRTVAGLDVTAEAGALLTVEHADVLGEPAKWSAFDRLAVTNPPQWCFDLSNSFSIQGFYRAWQTNPPGPPALLSLEFVPALTLTGTPDTRVRVDYVNALGPTDAWVTIDTVLLTNSTQLYFDVSAIKKPPRLWRIVPVP